jgi:hypothetical protein
MGSEQDAYNELSAYTLAHRDPAFIHQHVVDAFAAQHANRDTPPIKLTFALVGLYLHVEKNQTGRRVQRVHMTLAQRKRSWPTINLPRDRGTITAKEVMLAEPGPERDRAIDSWCASVWTAFGDSRRAISELLEGDDLG